jgi:hypothetical protein
VTSLAERRTQDGTGTRTPPHNLTLEAAVIGAVLYYPAALHQADGLTAEDFYSPGHGHIWDAAEHLSRKGLVVDPVTVADRLDEIGLAPPGGIGDLISLQGDGAMISAVPSYVRRIREMADARRMIALAGELAEVGYSGQVDLARSILDRTALTLIDQSRSLLVFEDVAPVVRGDIPDIVPTIFSRSDGQKLIYPGLTHSFAGEPTAGKTMASLVAVAEVLREGGRAMMVDYEGNRRVIGSRLRALGADPDEVAERFFYIRLPAIDAAASDELGRVTLDLAPDLVVVDGVARGIARQGGNEDVAADVLSWMDAVIKPLTEAGAAVIMLDHVTKSKDGRGRWARGSGAKLGEIEGAAFAIEAVQPWSRTRPGKAHIRLDKDREGVVGTEGSVVAVLTFMPAPDGMLTARVEPPDGAAVECESAILKVLVDLHGANESQLIDGLRRTGHKFRDLTVIETVESLVNSGRVTLTRGPRRAKNYDVAGAI